MGVDEERQEQTGEPRMKKFNYFWLCVLDVVLSVLFFWALADPQGFEQSCHTLVQRVRYAATYCRDSKTGDPSSDWVYWIGP